MSGVTALDGDADDEFMNPILSDSDSDMYSPRDTHSNSYSSADSEEDVEEQAEEVVANFMVRRYARNLSIEGEEFIPDISPDISPSPNSRSVAARLGRELADIGDDINERYGSQFKEMFRKLDISESCEDDAYESFAQVTRKLFERGVNWGRIVALLCFGYYTAQRLARFTKEFFRRIVKYVVKFITNEKIASWIAEQGGWVAAHTFVTASHITNSTFALIMVAAATSSLIAWLLSRFR